MESHQETETAIRSLQMQLAEGVDEWIIETQQSRYDAPKPVLNKPIAATHEGEVGKSSNSTSNRPSNPVSKRSPKSEAIPEPDFASLADDTAICASLRDSLPQALTRNMRDPIPNAGDPNAELVVLVDPPSHHAEAAMDLSHDEGVRLLLRSLAAIDVAIDSQNGIEPRARVALMPISPWRMPQNRKIMDAEGRLFIQAARARIDLRNARAVLLAGSNLAGLDQASEFGKLPVFELISPALMLREPMLKRRHWQALLQLQSQLDNILAI